MSDQNIPIDIHLSKLLDWLISRRICARDWQNKVMTVRKNINNAIQDMPAVDEITELLEGIYINYFHCLRIVELLKETESSSKNIFGYYSSQRMKDWLEIIKLYEKDNIYLAEAAQLLVRNIVYELPSLKKQITKLQQTQEECVKREADYLKNENSMRESYAASCRAIGIEGKNVKKELLALTQDLPNFLNEIAVSAKELSPIRNYYIAFLQFTIQTVVSAEVLPMLWYICERGNTSVFEWRTGKPPEVIENATPSSPLDAESASTDDQIDFGDLIAPSESSDDASSGSPNGDFVHVEKEECKPDDQIDFGESQINWEISVESTIEVLPPESTECDKVARGTDALTVLENETTRNSFHNDLLELECFLDQRSREVRSTRDDVLSTSVFQNAPRDVNETSAEDVARMLHTVRDISAKLTDEKLGHLYRIRNSPRYVDRLVSSLQGKLESAEKMWASQRAVREKARLAAEEQTTLEPRVEKIARKTKTLLKQIEEDISKRYKNRPVNIMGATNALQQFITSSF